MGDFTDKLLGTDRSGGNPKFRRRKKFQGATWTPENAAAELGDGLWCKQCKTRHGFMTLGSAYERFTPHRFRVVWSCKKSGDVLGYTELGGETRDA